MRNKLLCLLGIVIIFILLINGKIYKKSVFQYGQEVFIPYGDQIKNQFNEEGKYVIKLQEGTEDAINYWTEGTYIIRHLATYYYSESNNLKEIEDTLKNLDVLMGTYYRHEKFPRPPYKHYEYGWVSSMDAPIIALANQMAYELTGEEKYRQYRDDLKEYIIKPVEEGGFIMNIDEEHIWMFEYIEKGMSKEDAAYVLNGSMIGYQSILMLSEVLGDKDYERICEKQLNMYKLIEPYYWNEDQWSYYMLNEYRVNQPHYQMFEMKIFDALNRIKPDPFYKEQRDKRAKAFQKVMPLEARIVDGNMVQYSFIRNIAPNPYLIDIYTTIIEVLDKNKNIIATFKQDGSGSLSQDKFYNSIFMENTSREIGRYYRVYSQVSSTENPYLLFEGEVSYSNNSITIYKPLVDIKIAGDIVKEEEYILDSKISDDNKGIIHYMLKEPLKKESEYYIGIEVENKSLNDLIISINMYDSERKGVGRYYTNLVNGKNVIMLSHIGFSGSEILKDIAMVSVRIHTDEIEEQVNIELGDFIMVKDTESFIQYIKNSEYKINPQV